MKRSILAAAIALASTGAALAEAENYMLDASHSQVMFSYNHLGFSTTYGMFSGFEGEIMFDAENPAASSVDVSMPLKAMNTGWEKRDAHLLSGDFLGASDSDVVSFKSTSIEVTGENTAKITGDLTVGSMTASVVLDTVMNKNAPHPMMGKDTLGFSATTTIKRSDFGAGKFAPNVSDEMAVQLSIEAVKAK